MSYKAKIFTRREFREVVAAAIYDYEQAPAKCLYTTKDAAKDEEEAWYREGCFPGGQEDYIRQAKELLALARKAVNE